MPSVGSYGNVPSSIETLNPDTNTPDVVNISISGGDVASEQTYVFPQNMKYFLIKTRGNAQLRISYTLGGTSTNYITIDAGTVYDVDKFFSSALTMYYQLDVADVVEIKILTQP